MAGPGATKYIMIDDFLIDCSLSESHSFDSDVTEFPVESGSSISDNIRPLPITVDIEGFVSNTPIGLMRDERVITSQKPVETCYELLQAIRDEREPVTIQTSLRTYENMALTRLNIPRGPGGADGLRFTASFKQIQYVTNVRTIRVSIPIATGGTGKKKDKTSKVANPYDGLIITIDKFLNRWWDPDVAAWRGTAVYKKDPGPAISLGATTAVKEYMWHLYRQIIFPETVPTGLVFGGASIEPEPDKYVDSWRKSVKKNYNQQIRVPASQCVFHDFAITRIAPAPPKESDVKQILGNRSR